MQGMRVAAEPLSAPPYATECTMTLSGTETFWYQITEQKVKINTGQVSRINCQKSFLPIPGETSRLI